ncbi:MAG: DUF11 domain-containing protein, partial [Lachnospiraceae bacterium]|nr:DUF11 domain-containing protein [Lachnospiraceae bacterium]
MRLWKVDQDGQPVNGVVFGLYDSATDELKARGTTGHVDGRDGVIIFTPQPPAGAADGYAEVKWANSANTSYYLKEISAPAGYGINETKIPVVVGIYSIYADAGTADDGVTVMAGVGKLAQTMMKYASQGSVNISLRDITAIGQTQASGTFDLDGWQDMKLDGSNASRSLNLHYGMNAMVDYGLHDEDGGQTLYPFFVTDTGYIRTDVYQNYKALTTDQYGHAQLNSANKVKIDDSITSLFSLINIVVVPDKTTKDTKTGELVISKKIIAGKGSTLTDEDRTRTFEITLELKDKDGKALAGPYYFNGTDKSGYIGDGGVIYLHHDESITILGLPEGARYSVKEMKVEGYNPTPEDGTFTGTIISDGTQRADFINSKGDSLIGSIQIMKTVNSDDNTDKETAFEFTMTLGDTGINGTYGDLTFKDGVAKFSLKDGEILKAYGLPMDTDYEVVETSDDRFSAVVVNGKGKIKAGELVEVTFTNSRKEAEIPKIQIEKEQSLNDGPRTKNLLTAKPGDIVTYYITVTSVGNTTAKDVVVTDAVPSDPKGLTLVPGSISDGGTETNGVITWHLGDLDPG